MTGVVYDPRYSYLTFLQLTGLSFSRFGDYHCLWDDTYVENPERYHSVVRRCTELGLLERCVKVAAREVTREEMMLCHDESLLELLESSPAMTVSELKETSSKFDCLYISPGSWEAALLSAGGAVDLVSRVAAGDLNNGMALVRPPGHHAMRSESCGYCYINNIAIAVRSALTNLDRILIIDWDVHHGQGTQREFYGDSRVMYMSIHRYEDGYWWPNLRESDHDHIGEGEGVGYNVNIPLNTTGNTDTDYLHIWHQVLLPLATEFSPQLVVVSAGYDPALGCPEGEQAVSPACFAHLTHSLKGLAGGRVVTLLEGGYFPPSLAEGAALTLRSLLGDPVPALPHPVSQPCTSIRESVRNVQISLAQHWQVFSHMKDEKTTFRAWRGPEEPERPPYDIMCPTPARGEEEERHYTNLVQEMIKRTDLSVPALDTVSGQQGGDQAAVDMVVRKEARMAVVTSELGLHLDQESLVVCLGRDVVTGWKGNVSSVQICRTGDGGYRLASDGDSEVKEDKSLRQIVNKHLLPLAYLQHPGLVVVAVGPGIPAGDLDYSLHQLQSLAEGRMILIQNK